MESKEMFEKVKRKISISNFDKEEENRMIKNRKLLKIVAIIMLVVGVMSGIGYATKGKIDFKKIGLLKIDENYSEVAVDINKSIENEYFKLTLNSMAGDSSYLVLEYKIEFKDKALNEFKKITYDRDNGYNLGIKDDIFINSIQVEKNANFVNKISEKEYRYVEIIDMMNIDKDNIKLEIDLDRLYIGYGEIKEVDIKNDNEVYLDKKIEIEVQNNMENRRKFKKIEQKINNNTKVIIEEIGNTEFETFVKAKIVTENVTWEDYQRNTEFKYYDFVLSGNNDKMIQSYTKYNNQEVYVKNNGKFNLEEEKDIEEKDVVKVEENDLIILEKQNNNTELKIIPTINEMYDEDKEDKEYRKAKWYKLKAGQKEYSAKSKLGGTLTINNISIDDENVTFYYNEDGYIGNESLVVIRNKKSKKMNYIYCNQSFKKGLDANENKVIFFKKDALYAGTNIDEVSFEDMDNLEFTLLFGTTTKFIGKEIKIVIPEIDTNTSKFRNIKITDMKYDREDAIIELKDKIEGFDVQEIIATEEKLTIKGNGDFLFNIVPLDEVLKISKEERIKRKNKKINITDSNGKSYYYTGVAGIEDFECEFKITKRMLKENKFFLNIMIDGKQYTSELIRIN